MSDGKEFGIGRLGTYLGHKISMGAGREVRGGIDSSLTLLISINFKRSPGTGQIKTHS